MTVLRGQATAHKRRDPLHRYTGAGGTTSGRLPVMSIVQAPVISMGADPFNRGEIGGEVAVGIPHQMGNHAGVNVPKVLLELHVDGRDDNVI